MFARSLQLTGVFLVSLLAACGGADNQVVEPKLAEPIVTSGSTQTTLRLANEGGAPLTFEVSSSDARVVVTPSEGRLDANQARTLEVSAACDTGTVDSELSITSNDATNPAQSVPLTLTCGPSAGPVWWLSTNTLTIDGTSNGTSDDAQTSLSTQEVTRDVTLSNSGRVDSAYTLSSDQDWLSVAQTSGTLKVSESDVLELRVTPCTEPKRDQAELSVSGGGKSAILTVIRDCDIENTATLDLKMERFYINQSIPAADSSHPPHARRALIASREGLARAFVHANQLNDQEVTVRLHYKSAKEEGHLDLTGPASAPTQADEGDLNSTFNAMLDKTLLTPGLKIAVEIDPENEVAERNESNNRYPASGFVSLKTVRAPTLNLTLVPVSYEGNTPDLDEAAQVALLEQTRLLYPLSDINISVHAPYTFSGTLEARDGKGWNRLLSQLTDLRALEGSSDLYYGVVEPGYGSGIAGVGWVGGSPVSVGWNTPSSRSTVMAHELGHNWQRSHAPCNVDGDKSYPHNEGEIGVWGFDRSTQTLKEPSGHADIMGYCRPAWISDYTYDGILEYRQDHAFNIQSQNLPTDALIVSGSVERGAVTLNPVFQAKAATSTPTPGPYTLVGTDSAGRTLFNVPFSTQSVADIPERSFSGFNLAVPLSSADALSLTSLRVERNGKVLAEQSTQAGTLGTQSAQKTEVTRNGGNLTLTWDTLIYDAVIVRDGDGTILAMDESGEVILETQGSTLKLTFSNGLQSHEEVVTF